MMRFVNKCIDNSLNAKRHEGAFQIFTRIYNMNPQRVLKKTSTKDAEDTNIFAVEKTKKKRA